MIKDDKNNKCQIIDLALPYDRYGNKVVKKPSKHKE